MTREVCPKCNKSLLGGLIYETFLVRCEGDKEWARELAASYGATEEEGRWGKAVGIYDIDADRVDKWMCPHCHHTWPA
jgi:hypothetical protein